MPREQKELKIALHHASVDSVLLMIEGSMSLLKELYEYQITMPGVARKDGA